jgi:NitT/TauT family transport system ATP-binding protein
VISAPAPVTARAALPANAFPSQVGAAMQATPFLRFDGVAIRLGGREILSPTSFDVARGEFVCIVGPSGCGKTTLLRAASGLVTASAGEVRRNGVKMT